ncbi:Hpt domain-containing protein, partial [Chromobacterium piscinae]
LEQDLRQRYLRLGEAVAAQDQAASLDLLHALKGLAGQAGLHLVCEAVEHWEAQLQQGAGLRKDAWQALGRLIDSVL